MTGQITRRLMLGAAAATPASASLFGAFPIRAADVDRLEVGRPMGRFDLLKPGVRTYLRSQEKEGRHTATDIWRRETRFETIDGVPRLRIVQRWDGADLPPYVIERDSTFELETFRPFAHTRVTIRGEVRTVEGFLFAPDRITGLPGLADNTRADFSVAFAEPMFNFETDMEMLQTLPLAAGYSASIPFYHPAGGAPARYLWSVSEEAALAGPDGRDIECWVVQTDYNSNGASVARFWLAKGAQQLIKMESTAPDGVLHRKTLLF